MGKVMQNAPLRRVAALLVLAAVAPLAGGADADADADMEEVTVTGTRIQQKGMTTATPVASLSIGEITEMAPGPIVESLGQLPQIYSSAAVSNFGSNVNNFFTSPGGGCLNLRGVGCKRTLTLLNGRRVVSSSVYGGPDVNLFPKAVLKSVEMVTGGASAAWGTDAVAGVANFMLDTEFNGIRGHAQRGQTSRGDNPNSDVALTLGHALGERAHVLVSVDHFEQDPIYTWEGRDWYQGWGLIQSTATGAGSSRDNPRFIAAPQITSINASYDGVIIGWQPTAGNTVPAAFGRMIFDSNGQVSPFQYGDVYSTSNGAQTTLGGGSGTNNNSDRPSVQPSSNSTNAYAYLDLDVGAHTNVYLQGMYGKQSLRTTGNGGVMQPCTPQPQPMIDLGTLPPASPTAATSRGQLHPLETQITPFNAQEFLSGLGMSLDKLGLERMVCCLGLMGRTTKTALWLMHVLLRCGGRTSLVYRLLGWHALLRLTPVALSLRLATHVLARATLRATTSGGESAPRPATAAASAPVKAAIRAAAVVVLPMPTSPVAKQRTPSS